LSCVSVGPEDFADHGSEHRAGDPPLGVVVVVIVPAVAVLVRAVVAVLIAALEPFAEVVVVLILLEVAPVVAVVGVLVRKG
jgi:hypothetical protein